MGISIRQVHKHFGGFVALDEINLDIPEGELTALLGPSGSGKTTLLRCIAGLERPDAGSIHFFGENATNKPVKNRGVGFVFQHYALFKHMTIFDNVAFGLRIRPRATRPGRDEIREKVHKLLAMVQIDSMARRFPGELSGGQKQRVALARALAVEPRVLLLDEPFGALDAKVRQELRRWLRYLHDEMHITSVFVTHDQEEALEVADRIVILNKGAIEQVGTPEEIYDNPVNPFVYEFMGRVNLFHARFRRNESGAEGKAEMAPGQPPVSLFIRPHDIELQRHDEDGKGIAAKIIAHKVLGNRVRVELLTPETGEKIEANIDRKTWRDSKFNTDDSVYFRILGAKVYKPDATWSDYVI
ncbi:MAG: sulfate ABC transporter ATP-binding protein [Candidatus Accumulibacter sp.]|nr:sulfate ABC transporter ATP-binding protein [Accumulibacter sp.]